MPGEAPLRFGGGGSSRLPRDGLQRLGHNDASVFGRAADAHQAVRAHLRDCKGRRLARRTGHARAHEVQPDALASRRIRRITKTSETDRFPREDPGNPPTPPCRLSDLCLTLYGLDKGRPRLWAWLVPTTCAIDFAPSDRPSPQTCRKTMELHPSFRH